MIPTRRISTIEYSGGSDRMPMTFRLDHFFVLTDPGAPAANLLAELGFDEGSANSHPGQGTGCRRFFFANMMLEFLYVTDAREAEVGPAARFRFPARSRFSQASPFGFLFRSSSAGLPKVEFATWRYHPQYLPATRHFLVGEKSADITEPLVVIVPWSASGEMPSQAINRQTLSRINLTVPEGVQCEELQAMATPDIFEIRTGDGHLVEVEFDQGMKSEQHDLRPQLPLVFRY